MDLPSLMRQIAFLTVVPLAIGIALGLMLAACNETARPVQMSTVYAPRGIWLAAYSPGVVVQSNGSFEFPVADGVHYVLTGAPKLEPGRTIAMEFAIDGDAELIPTQGNPPARVRLLVQQRGDGMTSGEQHKRWWSTATVEMVAPGNYALSAPIAPEHWTNVLGKSGALFPEEFAAAIADAGNLGHTWGGTFAGHGVYAKATGTRFVLKSFEVM